MKAKNLIMLGIVCCMTLFSLFIQPVQAIEQHKTLQIVSFPFENA